MEKQRIIKVLTPEQYKNYCKTGIAIGSQDETFIHTLFYEQCWKIPELFNNQNILYILVLNDRIVQNLSLVVESNKPGGNVYPHFYPVSEFVGIPESMVEHVELYVIPL